MPQELIAVPVGRAMTVYLTRAEEGIGFVLARKLRLVCLRHAAANSARCFARHWRHKLCFARRGHFQLDVDAIGKRPRHATTITGDAFGGAAAAGGAVAAMPARARVHCGDELKTRWELRLARGACDRDEAGFERLAQRFQNIAVEFRQLIEEQDAVVRQRDLTGARQVAAADQRRRRGAVMRRAKWPLAPIRYFEALARHRVDRGDFERLGLR